MKSNDDLISSYVMNTTFYNKIREKVGYDLSKKEVK
jgi:hypothetical protein